MDPWTNGGRRAAIWMGWASAVMLAAGGCYTSTSGSPFEAPPDDGPDGATDPADGAPTTPPDVVPVSSFPAVAGGTLLVTRADVAVLSDPDHARILVRNISELSDRRIVSVPLNETDEPGRLVEDGAGRVHIVLRRAGAILDLDPATGEVLGRRAVCDAPRGLDWEARSDLLHVACMGGELVSLPAAGGPVTRTIVVDDDLRDVVAADGVLYVSRFRTAELLTLGADGSVLRRARPHALVLPDPMLGDVSFAPLVAWRIRPMPGGAIAMLHQQAMTSPIQVDTVGYAGLFDCPTGVVAPAVSIFEGDAVRGRGLVLAPTALLDFVVDLEGTLHVARGGLLAEGRAPVTLSGHLMVFSSEIDSPCVTPREPPSGDRRAVTAVALRSDGTVVLHRRAEGVLSVGGLDLAIGPPPLGQRGHELFHEVTSVGVSCASCHPEGGEDGHTWDFSPIGPRRTQTLLGGLSGHEPFHWNGDQEAMGAIMEVTFGQRMQGAFDEGDVREIERWIDAQPAVPGVMRDPAAVARGRALFESPAVGCQSCHSGVDFTNDLNVDVGTGRDFQVPSLIGVMHRAPYLHDGCAASLMEVVDGSCGTPDLHGRTASLTRAERADIVAFLRSL
jgi:cytochrome c553